MVDIKCTWCGLVHQLVNRMNMDMESQYFRKDLVRGVLVCGKCSTSNAFAMEGNVPIFLPGNMFKEELSSIVSSNAQEMYGEALKCFYGASYRGTITMLRSAVGEAILDKHVGSRNDTVGPLIGKAVKRGLLNDTDETRAKFALHIGNDIVHNMFEASISDATMALQLIAQLLNSIASRQPKTA